MSVPKQETLAATDKQPKASDVLRKLAAANPSTCECGHESGVHGFGSGECWTCAWDNDRPDCDQFVTSTEASK